MNGPRLIDTAFQVLHPTDGIKPMTAMLPATPSRAQVQDAIAGHFIRMAHMKVFYKNNFRDLFVETQRDDLSLNRVATGIVQGSLVAQDHDEDASSVVVRGPAVLFMRRVWF